MLAIDTNVVVRYLVRDDPKQSAKAQALIDREDVFVSTTVMLETEWVLRSVYGFSSVQICKAFRDFAGLDRVSLDDPDLLTAAIDRAERGIDFADALHVGRAEACEAFVTFDRKLIKAARAAEIQAVRAADA
jgi:predicted nucleic-acid-binding protein